MTIKDSGKREEYSSGMVRDTQAGKPMFNLINRVGVPMDQQMLTRWAMLMTAGAEKYGLRNWELACTQEEIDRFKESAFRHMLQWLNGETDEDHAAAVLFNIQACETTKYVMALKSLENTTSDFVADAILKSMAIKDSYIYPHSADMTIPAETIPAPKQTHNERDVKLPKVPKSVTNVDNQNGTGDSIVKQHKPEDHGPEFWSSDCEEDVCRQARVSTQRGSIHDNNIAVGNPKHLFCFCPLRMEGTPYW